MKWKVAVLDDDPAFLNSFISQLERCFSEMEVEASISLYTRWEGLLGALRQGELPEVILCDILLPDYNGVQLANLLQREYPQIKVVFITAVAANAVDIFQASPSYFLVKPIIPSRLREAMEAVAGKLEQENSGENRLLLCSKSGMSVVRKHLLEYVEIRNRRLDFHEAGRVISAPGKLDSIAEQLGHPFFRCHKSFLVNLHFVCRLNNSKFEMFSGHQVPIARNRLGESKRIFFSFAHQYANWEKEDFE